MILSFDTSDPAYWRRFADTARQLHAGHLAAARHARRFGQTVETARCLREASVDRNCLVIALDMERQIARQRARSAGLGV